MGFSNRESDILSACLHWLYLHGVTCWRQNQGAIPLKDGGYRKFVGIKGLPDIIGILPQTVHVQGVPGEVVFGNFLGIEVKKPGQNPRPDQRAFLDQLNVLGGIGLCVHSLDELEQQLGPYLEVSRRAVA